MRKENHQEAENNKNSQTNDLIQELQKQGILDDDALKVIYENPEAAKVITQIAVQHKQESYDSPFPHPDHLERFNELYPDAAETVFKEFERQGKHRRDMESIIVERGTKFDLNAQKNGFLHL